MNNITKKILDKISKKDETHAEYLYSVFSSLDDFYSNLNIQGIKNSKERTSETVNILGENIKKIFGRYNMIPSQKKGECQEVCLVKAEGRWKTQTGFYKMIKNEVTDYWLNCKRNQLTIILTSSWDQVEFDRDLRRKFEGYTIDKTALVIFIGEYDYAVLYAN